ncbi:MAG: DUF3126 family protein [Micavibrio sp.]|nr:DUF3126 family protein [Micavibrio sp.]
MQASNNTQAPFKKRPIEEAMEKSEITRLQSYLQQKFGNKSLSLALRKEAKDSVEVMLQGEFIGVIYRDEDEGEVSYDFNMAILEMDLPPAA